MLQNRLIELKISWADLCQPVWFHLDVTFWGCFSSIVSELEGAAQNKSSALPWLRDVVGSFGREGERFLLTDRITLLQGEVRLISSFCGHILMSNMREAQNRLQLNPAWHCCWYCRERWPWDCRTAQADSQELLPRKLNTKLLLSVWASSTWKHCCMDGGWWSNNNLWALSIQTIYQLSAVWSIIQCTKNFQRHNITEGWSMLAWGITCLWVCLLLCRGGGKSSMILHGQEVTSHSPENWNWAVVPFNESVAFLLLNSNSLC